MAIEITRYRFTADAYERLAAAGILAEDDRVELLEGEIVAMSPVGPRHVWCVTRLTGHLVGRLGDAYPVSVQSPIRLGAHDEPQPDLAVLRPEADQGRLPAAADVLLVIEVAETSCDYDRGSSCPATPRRASPNPGCSISPGRTWNATPSPARKATSRS